MTNNNNEKILLDVKNLTKYYPVKGGFFDKATGIVKAVDGVDLTLYKGKVFGLVGESGCGKTTTGKIIMRVLEPTGGEINFFDDDKGQIELSRLTMKELRPLRRKIQMIFQDPYSSLDPRMTIQQIVGEPLRSLKINKIDYRNSIAATLRKVGLSPDYLNRYPHELSGGQRQRVGIARALISNPQIIVADEPVSALDVSVQAQILNLLKELREAHELTYLFVSHDLAVIRYMSDVVAVMYVGKIVEIADCDTLFDSPKHPYTEALLSIVPRRGNEKKTSSTLMKGSIADASKLPSGCYFHPRCKYAQDICRSKYPDFNMISPDHKVACHFNLKLKGI